MIPNQWYPILRTSDVKDKPVAVRRCGEEVVLWRRNDGSIAALEDRCPHKGTALHIGYAVGDDIECKYHGFRFNGAGECVDVPCMGKDYRIPGSLKAKAFPIREQHDIVWMWWGQEMDAYPVIDLVPDVSDTDEQFHMMTWERPVNYTRYIESLLELYHVPFAHRESGLFNFIDYMHLDMRRNDLSMDTWNRFNKGFKCGNLETRYERDDTVLHQTFNLMRDGHPDDPGTTFGLTFQFPGMCVVNLPEFKSAIFLTPVDEHSTYAIFRWYEYRPLRNVLKVPLLRRALPLLSNWLAYKYQDVEDMHVIEHQSPKVSEVGANKFVAVDGANAKYLMTRQRLKREAAASMAKAADKGKKSDVAAEASHPRLAAVQN